MTQLAFLRKVRSEALRQAMRNYPCSLRIATFLGERCSHQSTVVGAHMPVGGKGMASKVSDIHMAAACFRCHEIVDGRDQKARAWILERYQAAYFERLLWAVAETQDRLVTDGVISVAGDENAV